MKLSTLFLYVVAAVALVPGGSGNGVDSASIKSSKITKLPEGDLIYYYDENSSSPCRTVAMLNVGTGMSVTNYNLLAQSFVTKNDSIISIIVDSNPGKLKKQDGNRYANLANAIVENLKSIVPVCANAKGVNYLVGGHSGGGDAAVDALSLDLLDFTAAAFVGLAPYSVSPESKISVPSLVWGFSTQSCLVAPSHAAKAAYDISSPKHRVFYQVQTDNTNIIVGGPHCSFADRGCFGMCSGGEEYAWIHDEGVADSIHLLMQAIQNSKFDRSQLDLNRDELVMYVNDEEVFKSDEQPDKTSTAVK